MPESLHALLLTDVADSTRLVAALGDRRAADVWSAHDRAARELLRIHDGLEVDRTDGLLLLFEDAPHGARHARLRSRLGR